MADRAHVILAGNLKDSLKAQLPSNVSLLPGADEPNDNEVHLILEYKKGERWGHIEAPRANRVIVHCDRTNAELKSMAAFHQAIQDTLPSSGSTADPEVAPVDMIVLSGLHLLDTESSDVRHSKMVELLHHIDPTVLTAKVPVHLELASMGNLNYVEELAREVVPHVDSIGLNEQELGFLYFAIMHDEPKYESSSHRAGYAASYVHDNFRDPSIDLVVNALDAVFQLASSDSSPRRLERIHFHSLKFHIIATRTGTAWLNPGPGLIHGSFAASVHACGFTNERSVDVSMLDLLLSSPESDLFIHNPVYHKKTSSAAYAITPVLVCKRPVRTVGLGDAISASGLLYHQFLKN